MCCIVQGWILDSTVKLYLGTTLGGGSWYQWEALKRASLSTQLLTQYIVYTSLKLLAAVNRL